MYNPYPYQVECLDAVQAVRDRGLTRALIVMASGLGKTVTMAFDAQRWRTENNDRVLFLCHNNDLLYQAKTTFEAVNGAECSYGYFHGQEKHLHKVDFLFASFQTAQRYRDLFDPAEFGYVVVDESHHSQANTYRSTIEYFRPEFLLGATATPDRLDELDIRDIYGQEVFYLPLEEAMAQRLVTPVDYRLLTDEIQLSGVVQAEKKRISITRLNRKTFIPKRDQEIAKIIARYVSEFEHPRTIIFCASIKHCEHMAKFVPNSFAIHSLIPQSERAVRLELFRQGVIHTLLTVDCFNEGIDVPQANVVVFLRSTVSNTIFLQQLGRGLRRSEGKDRVIVLDFVANCDRVKIVSALWSKYQKVVSGSPSLPRKPNAPSSPLTLAVDDIVEFKEKVVPILRLIGKVRWVMVSDVPHLRDEYSSRNELPLDQVVAGTNRKVWWKCRVCEHEWQATGNNRATKATGCPSCSGAVVTAKNNLAVLCPELAQEFSNKNRIGASQVSAMSAKRYWWLCSKCGYEWEQTVGARRKGSGCLACAGRRGGPQNNLAITHPHLVAEFSSCNTVNIETLIAGSAYRAWWKCQTCEHEWQTGVYNRARGSKCPACVGQCAGPLNNVEKLYPYLLPEYSKCNKISAKHLAPSSNQRVWWRCSACKHQWQTKVYVRTKLGSGCPACAGMAATKKNNLARLYPHLAAEYSKENDVPASEIAPGSTKIVWWRCSKRTCRHKWQASVFRRTYIPKGRKSGNGCPACAGRKVLPFMRTAG